MSPKKILFRCDSSTLIGTGHVMRCLSLAERLRDREFYVKFICRELQNNIITIIEKKQFNVLRLSAPQKNLTFPQPEANWLEVPLEQELEEIEPHLESFKPDWVVLDHYALGRDWENHVLKQHVALLVIDDIFRPHVGNLLLDQNFHRSHLEKMFKINGSTNLKYFLGPKYTLLPKRFDLNKRKLKIIPPVAKNILAFFGGSDPVKLSYKFLESCSLLIGDFDITLVIGPNNTEKSKLEAKALELGVKTIFATDDMYTLFEQADLFVGAGGTTNWERCFHGLPGIVVSIAQNQVELAKSLDQQGSCLYIGEHNSVSEQLIATKIQELARNFEKRSKQRAVSLSFEVGEGLQELIKEFF